VQPELLLQLPGIDEAGAQAVKRAAAELAVEQRRQEAEALEAARAAEAAAAAAPVEAARAANEQES